MQKLSPNPSCGIMIWMRAGLLQNTHAVFLSILHHRKDMVSPFDNQESRHWEKLPVHHQTWILSDDITSPKCPSQDCSLGSSLHEQQNWFITHIWLRCCSCHWIFCYHHSFDPWKLKCCCIQQLPCVVQITVEWNFTRLTKWEIIMRMSSLLSLKTVVEWNTKMK